MARLSEAAQSDDPVTSATEILQDVVARYGMDVDPEQIGEIARVLAGAGPESIADILAAISGRGGDDFDPRWEGIAEREYAFEVAQQPGRGMSSGQATVRNSRVAKSDVEVAADDLIKSIRTFEDKLLKDGFDKAKIPAAIERNFGFPVDKKAYAAGEAWWRDVDASAKEDVKQVISQTLMLYTSPEFGGRTAAEIAKVLTERLGRTVTEKAVERGRARARSLGLTYEGGPARGAEGPRAFSPDVLAELQKPEIIALSGQKAADEINRKFGTNYSRHAINQARIRYGGRKNDVKGGLDPEAWFKERAQDVHQGRDERSFREPSDQGQGATGGRRGEAEAAGHGDGRRGTSSRVGSPGRFDVRGRRGLSGAAFRGTGANGLGETHYFVYTSETPHFPTSKPTPEAQLATAKGLGNSAVEARAVQDQDGSWRLAEFKVRKNRRRKGLGSEVWRSIAEDVGEEVRPPHIVEHPGFLFIERTRPEFASEYTRLSNGLYYTPDGLARLKTWHEEHLADPKLGPSARRGLAEIERALRGLESEGMPLFAVGGGRIEPPRRGPEVSPEILGLAQAIATRFGMEMPDLAAKSFDDQISLLEKFLGQAEKVAQKGLKTATGEMQDILNQLDELRFFANANRQELEDIANETIAKITGSPAGRMINPFDSEFLQGKAGPLQARTLRIPDLHISDKGHAFADFLDDDIERVASSYVRSMAPDIALTREFGDLNLTETLRQIEDEAARLSEARPENSAQIQKQKTKDMRDLQDIVKRLRGTYNVNHDPSAWGPWTARRLKEWNVLRLMGAVVVSSIPDVMRLLMVHGFRNNADVFRTFAVDLKSLRIPKDQAKEMSAGLEFVMSKAGPMWDAFDDFGGHSRFDQTMQVATKKFGRLTLMDAWNSTLKQLSGAMTTSRVLRASVELSEGRISPKDLRKLAKSGISEDMALEIAKQYKQHGGMHGHLWLANANAWDQTDLAKRAAQALRAAVRKEADITIVTPGQEKPLWTSTHVGSVLAQFRTFQLVSVQRTLIPAVQEADAAIIVAVAGMIGLGMLSERLKQIVHGKKGGPETTGDWLYAGVANSGVLGWITDADQTLHKASRGNVSAARLLFGSDRPISRFASQNVTGSMLGPSFGAGQDLVTAFGGATTGDLSQGDIRAMRRLLPYQNLFYLSRALRAGEQGAMEAAGVPERRAN